MRGCHISPPDIIEVPKYGAVYVQSNTSFQMYSSVLVDGLHVDDDEATHWLPDLTPNEVRGLNRRYERR